MRLKILLASFLFSVLFFFGLNNVLSSKGIENAQKLTASVNQDLVNIKPEFDPEVYSKNDLEINAKAAISIEVNEKGQERILFEKNSEEKLPIASLTKLMTAFAVFQLGDLYKPSQLVKITKKAVNQEGSSKFGDLLIDEDLSVENLLAIALIESSNDAAFALSEFIGEENFVGLMNLYAKDLGLDKTFFINATGLEPDNNSDPINYSTAKDLSELAKAILKKYPDIFKITINRRYDVIKPDGTVHHYIYENTNELLAEVPEIIGGKTGSSPKAQECLLVVLKNPRKENSYFINVLLGAEDRFGEMEKLIKEVNKISIKNY